VIREKLQWYDVDNALKAVYTLRNTDRRVLHRNAIIAFIADNNRLSMPGRDLSKSILHLGVQRIPCHNDYDGEALIYQSKRPMLQLPGENACGRISG
jgi:hypothetical protein